jgi:NhaP-type Na+/H+ or K+/H+ antiporter
MPGSAASSLAIAAGVGLLITIGCERLRTPALLPLIAAGLALGASGFGVVNGSSLGSALGALITVSIGLLIFEGTLHLNRRELSHAPAAVRGLLTVGTGATWIGAAVLAHLALGFTLEAAAVLGAALIVTGPTVVQPILRRLRVTTRLHTALGAEAVFIDPLGVVATVATLEIVRGLVLRGSGTASWSHAAWLYVKPLLGGALVGAIIGGTALLVIGYLGRGRRMEPRRLNLIFLGSCLSSVGVGELVAPEAGLGAATVCGLILSHIRVIGTTEVRAFKEQIATILVAMLFILLASRFELSALASVGLPEVLFVAGLVLVVRPLSVAAATIGSTLSFNEKAFAALFAPRGIVALSVAAIAGDELVRATAERAKAGPVSERIAALAADAPRLELVMFLSIVTTVFLATAVSPLLARALRVRAGQAGGLVLVGGHALSLALARLLREHGGRVRVVDSNHYRAEVARAAGLDVVEGDATDLRWMDDAVVTPELGSVIAWTGNDTVDRVVARWGEERFGAGHAGIWSDGAMKPDMAALEIGGGRLLGETIDAIEGGRLVIAALSDTDPVEAAIGGIAAGQFRLGRSPETVANAATVRIGVRAANGGGAAPSTAP